MNPRANGDWAAFSRDAMALDKKARGSSLRFVLLDDLAKPGDVTIEYDELLAVAYEN